MEALYTTCKVCGPIRAAKDVLDGLDPCDGVHVVANIMTGDREEDQQEGLVNHLVIQCSKCRGTGITLTAEGRRFATAVLQMHKGALIV